MTTAPEPPPKVKPKIKSAPKIRQMYWCDFPNDAQNPEFWKRRPVIVISANARLTGSVTVIPCSTQAQTSKWAFPLHTTIDGKAAWAICNYPTTIAVSRLIPHKSQIIRMPEGEFNDMLSLIHSYLPSPRKI